MRLSLITIFRGELIMLSWIYYILLKGFERDEVTKVAIFSLLPLLY